MTETTTIETEVTTDSQRIRETDIDVIAYTHQNGLGTNYVYRRIGETTIEQRVERVKEGYRERVGAAETFDVDPETSTREFAQAAVENDPDVVMELTRAHWE